MKKSTLLTTSAIVIGLLTGTAYADTIRFGLQNINHHDLQNSNKWQMIFLN